MRDTELATLSYIVFDFETTGLEANRGDEIIEIGAIRVDGKNLTEKTFHAMVNPEREIPAEATRVHGITAADLKQARSITQVMPDFIRFLGQSVLVAQNARFDLSFLVKNLARLQISKLDNPIVDTMLLSKFLYSYESSHNLDAILRRLKIKADQQTRHRSIGDCRLTAMALVEMIDQLERRGLATLEAIRSCVLKAGAIPIVSKTNMNLFG